MGGAENALMLKILVCWLKWVEGAVFGTAVTSEIASAAAAKITLLIIIIILYLYSTFHTKTYSSECLKIIPLKPELVHPQVYTSIFTPGDFTTCL